MTASYQTYTIAKSSAPREGSNPAICTRSTSVELVKHIDPIGNILGISWITSEPPGKCLWFERWTQHISNIQSRVVLTQRVYLLPCWLHDRGPWINRRYGSNENVPHVCMLSSLAATAVFGSLELLLYLNQPASERDIIKRNQDKHLGSLSWSHCSV